MLTRRPAWVFIAGLLVAAGIGAYAAVLMTRDTTNICEAANDSREVLRNVLLLSQAQGQTRTFSAVITTDDGKKENVTITFPELADSERFYKQALNLVEPIQC